MGAEVTLSVNIQLKRLREASIPRLSIRAMAEALDIGYSRYAYFEDPKRFKKSTLPIDLTRKIAAVLGRHGIDPGEVMKLAGLVDDEAVPEAAAIEAQRPPIQFISMQVALPSEAALADMFEGLLALAPDGAPRSEVAKILARRLPSGFAAIGPLMPGQFAAPAPEASEVAQSPATDHPAPERASRT